MVEMTFKISDSTLLLLLSVPTELYACVDGFRAYKRDDDLLDITFDVINMTQFASLYTKVEQSNATQALSAMITGWTTSGLDIL